MPDPSEPSQGGPEAPGGEPRAPEGLRRRVLARVQAEPESIGSKASHAIRRIGRRPSAVAAGLAAAGVAIAIVLSGPLLGAGPGTLGRTRLAGGLGAARASLRKVGGHAELRLSAMPRPPVGEVYEVWLTRPGSRPQPTNALFNVTSEGTAAVEVPGPLAGVGRVTVTAEPVGGSVRPTSAVILTVALPAGR